MDLKLFASLTLGKLSKKTVKLSKTGGTAAPGLISLTLDKDVLGKLSAPLKRTILVSGTNGKTTTARLIGDYLEKANTKFVHNRTGSNLERGLVSALLEHTSLTGSLDISTGLFEVDEAAFPQVLPKLSPSVIVLTNLFRDQLDRYGEVDNIKRAWEKALTKVDKETILVVNADDPALAQLGKNFTGKTLFFGIDDGAVKLSETPKALDSSKCPNCTAELTFHHYYISHLGDYFCPKCGFERPKLDFSAKDINLSEEQSEFNVTENDQTRRLKLNLGGLYNIYNSLAAFSALGALGSETEAFVPVLENFAAAFGRGEKVLHGDKQILVTLAKNPTGFNEIIRTFLGKEGQTILFAINDKIADGRDVSWLWDVDFELLKGKNQHIYISGIRAADLALRLKYAETDNIEIEEKLEKALEKALKNLKPGETLLVVPTYTAMLSLKTILAKRKISSEFWED